MAALGRLGRLIMSYQSISRYGQYLVEDEHRHQIGRKGHANCPQYGDGEREVVSSLRVFFQRSHVSDRVEGYQDPEGRGRNCKYESAGVYLECEVDSWKEGQENKRDGSRFQDAWRHRYDHQEVCYASDDGTALSDVWMSPQEQNKKSRNRRTQSRDQWSIIG